MRNELIRVLSTETSILCHHTSEMSELIALEKKETEITAYTFTDTQTHTCTHIDARECSHIERTMEMCLRRNKNENEK